MKLKRGYTLSEIMIALVVLGTIIACCMPIISNMAPNKHAIMLKKAYFTTQQIISDLVNDPFYYPNGDFEQDANVNIDKIAEQLGVTSIAEGNKLRCLFASKLNLDTQNGMSLNDFCSSTNLNPQDALYVNDGSMWNFYNCPQTLQPSGKTICRLDVSTTQNLLSTVYNIEADSCIPNGAGWGGNPCDTPASSLQKINKIGKFAMFIEKTGELSLRHNSVTGFNTTNGNIAQQDVINIITGKTSLLGKPKD